MMELRSAFHSFHTAPYLSGGGAGPCSKVPKGWGL